MRLDSDGGLWLVKPCLPVGLSNSVIMSGFHIAFIWIEKHISEVPPSRRSWESSHFILMIHVFVPSPCHVSYKVLTGCGVYDEVVWAETQGCRLPLFKESLTCCTSMSYFTLHLKEEPFLSLRCTYLALHHVLVLCLWADVNFIREHCCVFKRRPWMILHPWAHVHRQTTQHGQMRWVELMKCMVMSWW